MLQGCSFLGTIQPSNKVTQYSDWLLQIYTEWRCSSSLYYTAAGKQFEIVTVYRLTLLTKHTVTTLSVRITLEGKYHNYKLRGKKGRSRLKYRNLELTKKKKKYLYIYLFT